MRGGSYFTTYNKKGEFEDLLRKGQLRGENEKKNVSDVFMMTLN
jgi:hypothetical protein